MSHVSIHTLHWHVHWVSRCSSCGRRGPAQQALCAETWEQCIQLFIDWRREMLRFLALKQRSFKVMGGEFTSLIWFVYISDVFYCSLPTAEPYVLWWFLSFFRGKTTWRGGEFTSLILSDGKTTPCANHGASTMVRIWDRLFPGIFSWKLGSCAEDRLVQMGQLADGSTF